MNEILLDLAQCDSYRVASGIANRLLRRSGQDEVKYTTLKYRTVSQGADIVYAYKKQASDILVSHGIDPDLGLISEDAIVPEDVRHPDVGESCSPESCSAIIEDYNSKRTEADKISDNSLIQMIEACPESCCYISIDDIGVKHQKEERKDTSVKDGKYVENTVIHILSGKSQYTITAIGMRLAFVQLVAFLLSNGLMENRRLVFLSDGATTIRDYIKEFFGFREYTLILDWLHLKKKCVEFMSMAVKAKNREDKKEIERLLLRILWAGNVDNAVNYLNNLKPTNIKNRKVLDDLVAYLQRKRPNIHCYALRHLLGLRTSSNTVEKANDLSVAQRQKHNGMSWSRCGSGALAAITTAKRNNELNEWIYNGDVLFKMAG